MARTGMLWEERRRRGRASGGRYAYGRLVPTLGAPAGEAASRTMYVNGSLAWRT